MKRNIMLGCSVVICLGILTYLWVLDQQSFNLAQETKSREALNLWTSNPSTVELAKEFEAKHKDIQVNIRYFYNAETLLEELYGAVSTTTPPHLAEISSHYGIHPLVESGGIVKVDEWLDRAVLEDLIPGIAGRFEYEDSLWAWPLGGSLPVIYVNQSMLGNRGLTALEEIKTWEDLWQRASKIVQEQAKEEVWGFHTDLQTPWYLLTMLRQNGWTADLFSEEDGSLTSSHHELGLVLEEWSAALYQYQIMPPLTHQLAITQFANGQGAFLLSSSEHVSLIDRLVAGKFEIALLPLPMMQEYAREGERESGYISGGSGIVVLQSEHTSEQELERAKQFISFLAQPETAKELSSKASYFPPFQSLLSDPNRNISASLSKSYQELIKDALLIENTAVTEYDQRIWETLLQVQERLESGVEEMN